MILNGNMVLSGNILLNEIPLFESNVQPIIINNVYYFVFKQSIQNYLRVNKAFQCNISILGGGGGGGACPMGMKAAAAGGGSGELLEFKYECSMQRYYSIFVGQGGAGGLIEGGMEHPMGWNGEASYLEVFQNDVSIQYYSANGGGNGAGISDLGTYDTLNGEKGGSGGGAAVYDANFGDGGGIQFGLPSEFGQRYGSQAYNSDKSFSSGGGGIASQQSRGDGGMGMTIPIFAKLGLPSQIGGGGPGIYIDTNTYGKAYGGAVAGASGGVNTGAGGSAFYADFEHKNGDGFSGGSGLVVIYGVF